MSSKKISIVVEIICPYCTDHKMKKSLTIYESINTNETTIDLYCNSQKEYFTAVVPYKVVLDDYIIRMLPPNKN